MARSVREWHILLEALILMFGSRQNGFKPATNHANAEAMVKDVL
jgi:hypothetical protein